MVCVYIYIYICCIGWITKTVFTEASCGKGSTQTTQTTQPTLSGGEGEVIQEAEGNPLLSRDFSPEKRKFGASLSRMNDYPEEESKGDSRLDRKNEDTPEAPKTDELMNQGKPL